MNETYFERAEKERRMLDLLFKTHYKGDNISYQHTPSEEKYTFDSSVIRFNEKNHLLDTHIWEAKIRDKDYDDILLERKKLRALRKATHSFKTGPEPVELYYVSTHPSGTWVFDLSKVNGVKWIEEEHNISTTDNVYGKEIKQVTYLKKSDGMFFPITTTELNLMKPRLVKDIIKEKIQGFQI